MEKKYNRKNTDISFFVQEYPTWITDEINTLRNKRLKVDVISFQKESIFENNIKLNNIAPIFILPPSKDVFRILKSIIKHPILFLKTAFLFVILIFKYNISWKLLFVSLPCIIDATKAIDKNSKFIHAHFAGLNGFYAAVISKILRIPFSVTVHAGDIYLPNTLLKFILSTSVKISAENRLNIEFLVDKINIERNKIFLSYMGVLKNDKIKYSKKLNKSDVFTIGSLALFVEKKGLEYLIRAIKILLERKVSIRLKLGGDGPLRNKLKEQVNSLGISSHVEFKGFIEPENRDQFFEELDVFCLPSVTDADGGMEGIPVVLMEAMKYGVPVISTRHSGIPELIEDSVTGFLTEEYNYKQLADTIEAVINNPIQSKQMSINAFDLVSLKFDIKKNNIKKAEELGWLDNN